MEGYQWGGRGRRMGEKVQGIISINSRYKIGGVKNSIGNVEAKELICTTYGHNCGGGSGAGGRGCAGRRRIKRRNGTTVIV